MGFKHLETELEMRTTLHHIQFFLTFGEEEIYDNRPSSNILNEYTTAER